MGNQEIISGGSERGIDNQQAAAERSRELMKAAERNVEAAPNRQAERAAEARRAANKEALMNRERGSAESKQTAMDNSPSLTHASKKQRSDSYKHTMSQIRTEMTPASRTFSKLIHQKSIERISDNVGTTVARPNAVLAGSIAATFLTLFVYVIARQYGYRLSGFETIGTFALGWAIGLIFDYAKLMFAKRV